MTRVDELQNKYQTIPRQTLVKAEALTWGIRDSDELYKHSFLHRTGGTGSKQTLNHGVSLKEMAEKRPEAETKPGYVKRLDSFYMRGGWPLLSQKRQTGWPVSSNRSKSRGRSKRREEGLANPPSRPF